MDKTDHYLWLAVNLHNQRVWYLTSESGRKQCFTQKDEQKRYVPRCPCRENVPTASCPHASQCCVSQCSVWPLWQNRVPPGRAPAADRADKQSLLSPKKTGAVLQLNEPLDLLPVTGRLTTLERVHVLGSRFAEHRGWRTEARVAEAWPRFTSSVWMLWGGWVVMVQLFIPPNEELALIAPHSSPEEIQQRAGAVQSATAQPQAAPANLSCLCQAPGSKEVRQRLTQQPGANSLTNKAWKQGEINSHETWPLAVWLLGNVTR